MYTKSIIDVYFSLLLNALLVIYSFVQGLMRGRVQGSGGVGGGGVGEWRVGVGEWEWGVESEGMYARPTARPQLIVLVPTSVYQFRSFTGEGLEVVGYVALTNVSAPPLGASPRQLVPLLPALPSGTCFARVHLCVRSLHWGDAH